MIPYTTIINELIRLQRTKGVEPSRMILDSVTFESFVSEVKSRELRPGDMFKIIDGKYFYTYIHYRINIIRSEENEHTVITIS